MIPGPFQYHRPGSLDDAVGLLASLGDEALVLAGGHSLIPMMKLRMAVPEHLVDLAGLAELRGVREDGGTVYRRLVPDDAARLHNNNILGSVTETELEDVLEPAAPEAVRRAAAAT